MDKLVKISTVDGEETWVVVHVEVQGTHDPDFAQRMFVYYYRLFDRYHRRVASLAVLADERTTWHPDTFRQELWDCEVQFTFPSVKLLDYVGREPELESSRSVFAIVVLAYLKALVTHQDSEDRLQWKFHLVKLLYARGYRQQDILAVFRCIDWMMTLSRILAARFDEIIFHYEEECRCNMSPALNGMVSKKAEKKAG